MHIMFDTIVASGQDGTEDFPLRKALSVGSDSSERPVEILDVT